MKSDKCCECQNWCDIDLKHRIATGHAKTCPNAPDYAASMEKLINELLTGIDEWAQDCDGVHEALWFAYRKAKLLNGVFVFDEDHD